MTVWLICLMGSMTSCLVKETPIQARIINSRMIWNQDQHSAFTDLIRWKDQFVCIFRFGKAHVSPDGALQLLVSSDGSNWQTLARITSPVADLRDPKLMVGLKGELLIYAAGAMHDKAQVTHRNYVWSSNDGKKWSEPREVGEPDNWLWRVTNHDSGFYGWGYGTGKNRFIQLFKSSNGKNFEAATTPMLREKGYANESAMVMEGKHAWCLLRRDGASPLNTGLIGTAVEPFANWTWHDLGIRIGGPSMLRLPSGQFLATVRLYTPKVRTVLCQIDMEKFQLRELLTFPSGGDCSYAGMVWFQQKLWVSYYSSHEGKSSIYIAEVEVKEE